MLGLPCRGDWVRGYPHHSPNQLTDYKVQWIGIAEVDMDDGAGLEYHSAALCTDRHGQDSILVLVGGQGGIWAEIHSRHVCDWRDNNDVAPPAEFMARITAVSRIGRQ